MKIYSSETSGVDLYVVKYGSSIRIHLQKDQDPKSGSESGLIKGREVCARDNGINVVMVKMVACLSPYFFNFCRKITVAKKFCRWCAGKNVRHMAELAVTN